VLHFVGSSELDLVSMFWSVANPADVVAAAASGAVADTP
jgi:hypothetical protein